MAMNSIVRLVSATGYSLKRGVDDRREADSLPYARAKAVDVRDRVVSLVATAIVGIVALAFLTFTLLNGIGAILAHFDSQRYRAAQSCDSRGADKSNCILTERATVEDIFGGISFLVRLPSGDTRLVTQAKLVLTPTVVERGNSAEMTVWNGKIVQLAYDSEIVQTTDDPDLYVQSWPVTLTFGLITCAITGIVYLVVSWATGYPVFERPPRRRRVR